MKTSLCLCALFIFPVVAESGTLDEVKVGLHLEPYTTKNICEDAPSEFGCDNWNWTSDLNINGETHVSYNMYIVALDVAQGVGIRGIEFGIDYDASPGSGLDPFGVSVCADQEFSGLGWPNAGGAVTYTWLDCQNTPDPSDPQGDAAVVAAAIYVYAYHPDTACIVPKPSTVYGATDCAARSSNLNPYFPENSGCAGFGERGYQPCWLIYSPVEETTWGAVKRQFRGSN